jgi:hypothetical protein
MQKWLVELPWPQIFGCLTLSLAPFAAAPLNQMLARPIAPPSLVRPLFHAAPWLLALAGLLMRKPNGVRPRTGRTTW